MHLKNFSILIFQKKRLDCNMFPVIHYIKGFFRNAFNKRISLLAIISTTPEVDKSSYIYRGVKAKYSKIGAYSYISANTEIENAEIGKYCSIADHCRIGMSTHSLNFLSTSPIFTQKINALQEEWTNIDVFKNKSEEERVYIGNDVWIGSHVLIKGGVHLGDGAVIGAVVVKDVPPYAIVGGVPASIIRYRFPSDVIADLLKIKWWNLDPKILKSFVHLFQNEKIDIEQLKTICDTNV